MSTRWKRPSASVKAPCHELTSTQITSHTAETESKLSIHDLIPNTHNTHANMAGWSRSEATGRHAVEEGATAPPSRLSDLSQLNLRLSLFSR